MVSHRDLMQGLVSLTITFAVMGAALFLSAGALLWPHGLTFLAAFFILVLVSVAWLWRVNPEIRRPEARDRRRHEKLGRCPDFDFTGWVPRHPDRGRARRRPLSLGARSPLGCYCWLRSFGSGWAQAVNRHFEPSVRIQTDRDHHVVTTGPYAFVRHPGYVSGTVLVAGMALALGSLWALLPAAFVAVVLVIRTNLEDATLQRELPGYAGYAARVRSKWIPGVW